MPCSPSGMAQPRMMSSTISGLSPGVLSMRAFRTGAANSSGWVSFRLPFFARPIGVLATETMTAFLIVSLLALGRCCDLLPAIFLQLAQLSSSLAL